MTRINTNVSSLIAQNTLRANNGNLETSLQRLSTGFRINQGKDDPAGLIASENLRSELSGITAAIGNGERADQVLSIAEGGLQEVSRLLSELQGLVVSTANDAGLSQEEVDANQLQIDSILTSIDRLASTTNFQGTKLLDGTYDFNISGQSNTLTDVSVTNAAGVTDSETVSVDYAVTQSAQQGGFLLSLGGSSINLSNASSRFTIEVGGTEGSREFTFASGTTVANIASQINDFTDELGIVASANGGALAVQSEEYGDSEFVSVRVVDAGGISSAGGVFAFTSNAANSASTSENIGTFANLENANTIVDEGQDIGGTINGLAATGEGRSLSLTSDTLSVEFTLASGNATALAAQATAFEITGGGATFALGSDVNLFNEATIGIRSVAARNLGSIDFGGDLGRLDLNDLKSGAALDMNSDELENAQQAIDKAISQVSTLRGQIGAFQANIVAPTLRNLSTAFENTSAAESQIRDTDFASETANLTRNQILVNASISSLGVANVQPANVLSLLG